MVKTSFRAANTKANAIRRHRCVAHKFINRNPYPKGSSCGKGKFVCVCVCVYGRFHM